MSTTGTKRALSPAAKPAAKSAAKPAAKPATKPAAKPATKPITAKAAAKPRAKTAAKKAPQKAPKATASAREPFLRFYHPEPLRAKTLTVLTGLEKAKDARAHRGALSDIVAELTDSGMDYFFLRPLKLANVGFFVEQSANLGMSATTSVLGSVVRKVIGGMDDGQLLTVSAYIRELMR